MAKTQKIHERSILPEEFQSQPVNLQTSCLIPDPRRKQNRSENDDGDQGDGDQGQDMCPPSISENRREPRLMILLHVPLALRRPKRKRNGQ